MLLYAIGFMQIKMKTKIEKFYEEISIVCKEGTIRGSENLKNQFGRSELHSITHEPMCLDVSLLTIFRSSTRARGTIIDNGFSLCYIAVKDFRKLYLRHISPCGQQLFEVSFLFYAWPDNAKQGRCVCRPCSVLT